MIQFHSYYNSFAPKQERMNNLELRETSEMENDILQPSQQAQDAIYFPLSNYIIT